MNVLTFDIEDWFHILDVEQVSDLNQWSEMESRLEIGLNLILDLLDHNNLTATFFVLGWIAERYPKLVLEIDRRGHDIGSHSYAHQLVYTQSKEHFIDDLDKSLGLIEQLIGKKITSYRAPGFSVTRSEMWVFAELCKRGISRDASVFCATRGHGGLPELIFNTPFIIKTEFGELREYPVSYFNFLGTRIVFSGGGYFRLVPKPVLSFLLHRSHYNMIYLHPRDLDPYQPRLSGLSLLRHFKTYVGLHSTESKLERVLSDANLSLREFDDCYNWDAAEILDLSNVF